MRRLASTDARIKRIALDINQKYSAPIGSSENGNWSATDEVFDLLYWGISPFTKGNEATEIDKQIYL